MATVAEAFELAGQCLNQGDAARAEVLYRQVLQIDPAHVDAHCNLGVALARQNQLEEAVAHYREALRLRPDYPAVHFNLGNALRRLERFDEAVASYRAAVRHMPGHGGALYNLALALMGAGKPDEAAAAFHQSILLTPNNADAHNWLGDILRTRGRYAEALTCFQNFLRLAPQDPRGHNNLGITLAAQGKGDEALAALQQALRLKPDYADAHCNLGIALADKGRLDEAIAHSEDAVRLKPSLVSAHTTLGLACAGQGRLHEAIAHWREALRLKPDFAGVHSNILYALNFDPAAESAILLAAHREWEAAHGRVPATPRADVDRDPERMLRVGYLSPDFRRHPITLFLLPILRHHDPARVHSVCYAEVEVPDAGTAQCQALAREWRSICHQPDAAVAELIRRDRIDLLVDLAGHTNNNRLAVFAHKPAPVQVSYLGYPNTTGLAAMDYRLTDAVADPPGEPSYYTEELVRLTGCFCCFQAAEYAPAVGPSPAARNGHMTFGSVHNLVKLNAGVLDLWAEVLRAVPTARLLVYRNTLAGSARDRLRQEFTARGIAEDRVELRHGASPGRGYLDVYADIDVLLDTLPWSAHTTACEALWQGVPVLTLRGTRHAGRMAASILTAAGLPGWIAETPAQYVGLARDQAANAEKLAALRATLRDQVARSPLCDGLAFTRRLEEAYRWMWRRFAKGGSQRE